MLASRDSLVKQLGDNYILKQREFLAEILPDKASIVYLSVVRKCGVCWAQRFCWTIAWKTGTVYINHHQGRKYITWSNFVGAAGMEQAALSHTKWAQWVQKQRALILHLNN